MAPEILFPLAASEVGAGQLETSWSAGAEERESQAASRPLAGGVARQLPGQGGADELLERDTALDSLDLGSLEQLIRQLDRRPHIAIILYCCLDVNAIRTLPAQRGRTSALAYRAEPACYRRRPNIWTQRIWKPSGVSPKATPMPISATIGWRMFWRWSRLPSQRSTTSSGVKRPLAMFSPR